MNLLSVDSSSWCGFLVQAHMLFQLKVSSKDNGQHHSRDLLFVRYYCTCPLEACYRHLDLSLQHLVWEEEIVQRSKTNTKQPHYAVVDCSSVLQQACI